MTFVTIILAAALSAGSAGVAQDEVLSMTGRENWNAVSRSATRAYLADIDSMITTDGVMAVRVARVPLTGPAGDYSHSIDTFEIRCAAKQSRTTVAIEYGPDAAQTDRFEDASPWEDIRAGTLDEYVRSIACDGDRTEPAYPTVKAFIDAGRP